MNLMADYNSRTYKKAKEVWKENLKANKKHIKKGANFEKFGKVCIIVGAGPSLDFCHDYLRYAQDNLDAMILCTDSAIRPCVRNGVRPDVFITVDAEKDIRHFVGAVKDTPLIAYTTCNPAVLEWHKGQEYFINNSCCLDPEMSHLYVEGLPLIGSGGNVATVALAYATELGYKKIVLVGVDLDASGTETYAHGSLREGLPAKDIGLGGLHMAKIWIESFIKSHKEIQVTNITRTGVKFKGAENVPM